MIPLRVSIGGRIEQQAGGKWSSLMESISVRAMPEGGGDIFPIDEAGEVIGPLRDPVSNVISEILSVISKQQYLDIRRTLETIQERLRENRPIDNSERLLLLNLVNASLV